MHNSTLKAVVISWLATVLTFFTSELVRGDDLQPSQQLRTSPSLEAPAMGTTWPAGQALPNFATPVAKLDVIEVQALTGDEQITFSSLQGQVNRQQPRIFLLDTRSDAGRDTWLRTPSLNLQAGRTYHLRDKYKLLAKYANELDGLVLYDVDRSPHFRNLAGTIAGLKRLLPVTPQVRQHLVEEGIELEVVVDLTQLEATSPIDIYTHLYETYWPQCEKRILLSARPNDRGGDLHHTRDLAAACGAAVVWLDCQLPEERNLLQKFLADMQPGNALVLGWYTSERSGITTASEFGIGTLPADHYLNATVYSGGSHLIRIPTVPKMPRLENKTYVAIFVSDGDNIQYNQRAMRKLWDHSRTHRGKIPLNWTISPSLVDIGPGLLNYYYDNATPLDCFVSGPSGMGYLIPYNTLKERGAPLGEITTSPQPLAAYTQLSGTYLQRSGLRAITIWDNASAWQRAEYEKHCQELYGVTIQNFRDVPSVQSSIVGDRLRFEKLVIPYANSYQHFQQSLRRHTQSWQGEAPQFLAYQVNIWGEMKPERLVEFVESFERDYPDQIQFVRADHFFNLYNLAHQLPVNLALHPDTIVTTKNDDPRLPLATDGTPATIWTSSEEGPQALTLELDKAYTIVRLLVRHAGESGLDTSLNTRTFSLQLSEDGKTWQTVARVENSASNVVDLDLPPTTARQARIMLEEPGADGIARIADIEIYGLAK